MLRERLLGSVVQVCVVVCMWVQVLANFTCDLQLQCFHAFLRPLITQAPEFVCSESVCRNRLCARFQLMSTVQRLLHTCKMENQKTNTSIQFSDGKSTKYKKNPKKQNIAGQEHPSLALPVKSLEIIGIILFQWRQNWTSNNAVSRWQFHVLCSFHNTPHLTYLIATNQPKSRPKLLMCVCVCVRLWMGRIVAELVQIGFCPFGKHSVLSFWKSRCSFWALHTRVMRVRECVLYPHSHMLHNMSHPHSHMLYVIRETLSKKCITVSYASTSNIDRVMIIQCYVINIL